MWLSTEKHNVFVVAMEGAILADQTIGEPLPALQTPALYTALAQ